MMRFVFCLALAVCVGCSSPSPRFFGATRVDVATGGMQFSVYRRSDEVEAIRISREYLPRESSVLTNAVAAIEQATGCPVRPRSVSGDQSIITAEIDCRG